MLFRKWKIAFSVYKTFNKCLQPLHQKKMMKTWNQMILKRNVKKKIEWDNWIELKLLRSKCFVYTFKLLWLWYIWIIRHFLFRNLKGMANSEIIIGTLCKFETYLLETCKSYQNAHDHYVQPKLNYLLILSQLLTL